MPPAPKGRFGIVAWVLVGAFVFGVVWLSANNRWSVAVFAGIAAPTCLTSLLDSRRRRRNAALRATESICTFARSLDTRRTDTWVLRAAYEELHSYVRHPIRPGDRLRDDLRLDDDDVEQLMISIADRTGRSLVDCERNPYFGRVHNVAGVVQFLIHQPKLESRRLFRGDDRTGVEPH